MGQSTPYGATLSSGDLETLCKGLVKVAERMTPDQLADLADSLHEMRRARRNRETCHRCDARI